MTAKRASLGSGPVVSDGDMGMPVEFELFKRT
ncbi:predicted protein [Sclerotinia sclerotiorum 1980 UF-70]|uniref:Uncharacterized protein n=1 Tax=Sclerotinia sclerotiorum (strain ATCC 18683 / 1980 / Ss-1) TaxID=665079 RepID=A7F5P4_SCLS1|nr:predicted protein [Sclerotinia sclerotiorum 1980 UF-70]EDN98065.1 predicted protein [Sclerotinia sclerotiorum 1980 UF-70]